MFFLIPMGERKGELRNATSPSHTYRSDAVGEGAFSVQFTNMKVRTSIPKRRLKKEQGDVLVKRKGRLYLINKKNPNRKMRQK